MSRSLCEEHNWEIDPNGCPVCEGMEIVKKRVRELHTEGLLPIMGEEHHLCVNCMHKFPCPTIKALDGETE